MTFDAATLARHNLTSDEYARIVKALGRDGHEFTVQADGLFATVIQHEMDHLDGVLFVDHISTLKRELIKRRMRRLKAEREQEKREGARPRVDGVDREPRLLRAPSQR